MVRLYRIAIVGAGTGGLAAALMLAQDGHDITIYDAFDHPRPLGSGLLLQPTGLACLALMGLDQDVIAKGAIITHLAGHSVDGRPVFDIAYDCLAPDLFGIGIHRGLLFRLLFDRVGKTGIGLETGRAIVAVSVDPNGVRLEDASGEKSDPFDLVVDASGRNSSLASASLGRQRKPFPYGAVWSVVDGQEIDLSRNCLHQRYRTAHQMMGLLPLNTDGAGNRDLWAFFWSLPHEVLEVWNDQEFDRFRCDAVALWPEVSAIIDRFEGPENFVIATYDQLNVKRPYTQGLVAIGDAAHGTSPQLGQGANLALADAVTLAATIREEADLNAVGARYWQARRGPVRFYKRASWLLTPFFQSNSVATAWLRDRFFHPLSKAYFFDRQMVRTLAGVKTGPLSSLDPADWSAAYGISASAGGARQSLMAHHQSAERVSGMNDREAG